MKGLKAIVIVAVAALVALSVTGVALARGGPAGQAQLQARGIDDHPGPGPGLWGQGLMGEVTAKDGVSITIKTNKGAIEVVVVTSNTVYSKPGQAAASLADVVVGARIAVLAQKVGEVLTASQVIIMPPPPPAPFHVQGTVTTVAGSTITITDKDGKITTLTLPAGAAGVSVGDRVNIVIGQPFSKGGGHMEFKGRPEKNEKSGHDDDDEDDDDDDDGSSTGIQRS